MVKGTCCSCRGPKICFPALTIIHNSSSGGPTPSSELQGRCAHIRHMHIWRPNTHTYKINKSKSKRTKTQNCKLSSVWADMSVDNVVFHCLSYFLWLDFVWQAMGPALTWNLKDLVAMRSRGLGSWEKLHPLLKLLPHGKPLWFLQAKKVCHKCLMEWHGENK